MPGNKAIAVAAVCWAMLSPGAYAGQTPLAQGHQPLAKEHEHLLRAVQSIIRDPGDLSQERLYKLFPAKYSAVDCPRSYTDCTFVNESERSGTVSLSTFQLRNPQSGARTASSLLYTISSDPCLKKDSVDLYVGDRAVAPSVQPPWTLVKGDETVPFQMEYTKLKSAGSAIRAYIYLTGNCVTQLHINF